MADNAEIANSQESTYVNIGFFWKVINPLKALVGTGGWLNGVGVPASSLGINGNFYLNTSNGDVYLKVGGVWVLEGSLSGGTGVQNNFTAVTNPSVNDDSSAGYSVGSGWFNTISGQIYFAQSVTVGAAIWVAASGGISGSGATGQVAYWTSGTSLAGDSNFIWDAATKIFAVGDNLSFPNVSGVYVNNNLGNYTFGDASGSIHGGYFGIDSTGKFTMNSILYNIAGVDYSFPLSQGAPNTFLRNDGSGNLTWVVGAQGAQGSQGAQGFQGFQGNQGNQGFQGNQGTQGFQGNQGNQGNQGTQGNQGAQGNQGTQGNQGAQGAQGAAGSITSLTSAHILVGNVSNVPTDVAMSGDIGIDNAGATTIQPNAVTYTKAYNGIQFSLICGFRSAYGY